ncbi:hypothetical protein ACLB2K_034974 [Fragaria x ananassa]
MTNTLVPTHSCNAATIFTTITAFMPDITAFLSLPMTIIAALPDHVAARGLFLAISDNYVTDHGVLYMSERNRAPPPTPHGLAFTKRERKEEEERGGRRRERKEEEEEEEAERKGEEERKEEEEERKEEEEEKEGRRERKEEEEEEL